MNNDVLYKLTNYHGVLDNSDTLNLNPKLPFRVIFKHENVTRSSTCGHSCERILSRGNYTLWKLR